MGYAPVSKSRQPMNWQDATAGTIKRIQQIFGLAPEKAPFTIDEKLHLIERAQAAVHAQGKITSATEYWNTVVNSLRTIVAGMLDINPEDAFD